MIVTLERLRTPTLLPLLALALAACAGENLDALPASEEPVSGDVILTAGQLAAAALETQVFESSAVGVPLRVPGTVIAPDTAVSSLGSLVEGQVGRVRVVIGDRVAAGTELLRIHSHELTDALRDRQAAEAQVSYRRSALERSRTLYEAGAVSREEVERRDAEYEVARAEVTRSAEWVRHLTPSPEGDVVVRAPRSGVVLAVHARPGAVVTPGAPLVEIGNLDVLWVQGFVPEASAVQLMPGAEVRVEVPLMPDVAIPGRLVRMGETIDPVRRAVEVRVELAVTPPGLRPGLYATLWIPGPELREQVVLPAAAVQRVEGEEIVFLEQEPGRYRPQPVRAQALGDGTVTVEGLPPAARVVTRGAYTLRSVLAGIEVE